VNRKITPPPLCGVSSWKVIPNVRSDKCQGANIQSGAHKRHLQVMFIGGAYCMCCAESLKEISNV